MSENRDRKKSKTKSKNYFQKKRKDKTSDGEDDDFIKEREHKRKHSSSKPYINPAIRYKQGDVVTTISDAQHSTHTPTGFTPIVTGTNTGSTPIGDGHHSTPTPNLTIGPSLSLNNTPQTYQSQPVVANSNPPSQRHTSMIGNNLAPQWEVNPDRTPQTNITTSYYAKNKNPTSPPPTPLLTPHNPLYSVGDNFTELGGVLTPYMKLRPEKYNSYEGSMAPSYNNKPAAKLIEEKTVPNNNTPDERNSSPPPSPLLRSNGTRLYLLAFIIVPLVVLLIMNIWYTHFDIENGELKSSKEGEGVIQTYVPYLVTLFLIIGILHFLYTYFENRNSKIKQAEDIYDSIILKLRKLKGTEREWISEKLLKAEIIEGHEVNDKSFVWNWIAKRSKRDKRLKVQPLSISGEQIQTWTYADF